MRVDSALACHCFVIIFILLRDKNAAKTESSIEFITPNRPSLTRGYQQLTHSGPCAVFYDQKSDFQTIKIKSILEIFLMKMKRCFLRRAYFSLQLFPYAIR